MEVDVSTAIASFVLSWTIEGQPVTVSLAKPDFDYHVDHRNIVVQ
jgi:GH43 family beta-xylosidase